MTFTINKLTGHRVAVSGEDTYGNAGSTVLDSRQWDEINQVDVAKLAHEAFDAKVMEFFEPLTEAAEAHNAAVKKANEVDELTYITVQEHVEGQAGSPEIRRQLSHDSQVLRLLGSGDHRRLIWVGDNLEILEEVKTQAAPAPAVAGFQGVGREDLGPLT